MDRSTDFSFANPKLRGDEPTGGLLRLRPATCAGREPMGPTPEDTAMPSPPGDEVDVPVGGWVASNIANVEAGFGDLAVVGGSCGPAAASLGPCAGAPKLSKLRGVAPWLPAARTRASWLTGREPSEE